MKSGVPKTRQVLEKLNVFTNRVISDCHLSTEWPADREFGLRHLLTNTARQIELTLKADGPKVIETHTKISKTTASRILSAPVAVS